MQKKKMGSIATLKLTKLYKLKDGSRPGLNSINYAKILLYSRMHIKIKERKGNKIVLWKKFKKSNMVE